MKVAKYLFLISFFLLINIGFADDGMKEKFKNVHMNINNQNYIIFEDDNLIVCDRDTDKYLVEITSDNELYIRSEKIHLNRDQKELLQEYYEAQQILFSKRNSIGAKGLHIGMEGVKLAATAVGGVVELALSGFDEDVENEFEQEMETQAEKLEKHAESIEDDAEEFEYQVDQINRINRMLGREIDDLYYIDLSVDEDRISFNGDIE